jgi:uncharacterized lipoprotein YmbA
MRIALFAAALALSACTATPTLRYAVPPTTAADRIAVSVGSIEVRDVSLPLYAELETIAIESPDGQILSDKNLLWADQPIRAVTQGLADALSSLTRAQVAAEPWPLNERPDARIEVRFSQALARADGTYRMAGQYFVASLNGERREIARRFDIAVPYAGGSAAAIAAAQGDAIIQLARTIAKDGL